MTCEIQNVVRGTSQGQVIVIDASGLSFGHLARVNLMSIKKILYYVQEAIPIRLKSIHIFNTVPVVDTLFNMIKPFAKAELLKLVSQYVIRYHTRVLFEKNEKKKKE